MPTWYMLHYVVMVQSRRPPQDKGNICSLQECTSTGNLNQIGPPSKVCTQFLSFKYFQHFANVVPSSESRFWSHILHFWCLCTTADIQFDFHVLQQYGTALWPVYSPKPFIIYRINTLIKVLQIIYWQSLETKWKEILKSWGGCTAS